MYDSLISIGSNVGRREIHLQKAISEISYIPQTEILKQSEIINTKALEVTSQPDFLNVIIKILTKLQPYELLETLQNIEVKIGRIRRFDKGPREIDIDILTYSDRIIYTKKLIIPHSSLYTRPFIKELILNIGEESVYSRFDKHEYYKFL
ncbi:MAG: 2-amino-4-hydroxy-6-hydroxymethyldihydropteridine diphosphokinase [Leptospiraceae bacterium]|nr:2-amino-4-hydroxy-6-hydroxymethyldihydropteridine diphosphokinase [Leptospiraceae bacterium]MCP5493068.1 2-amino-4-hydroxy-6-hydroxymethyldihydropteridine diphosphokinase [Leptospiraceae bacterium]